MKFQLRFTLVKHRVGNPKSVQHGFPENLEKKEKEIISKRLKSRFQIIK